MHWYSGQALGKPNRHASQNLSKSAEINEKPRKLQRNPTTPGSMKTNENPPTSSERRPSGSWKQRRASEQRATSPSKQQPVTSIHRKRATSDEPRTIIAHHQPTIDDRPSRSADRQLQRAPVTFNRWSVPVDRYERRATIVVRRPPSAIPHPPSVLRQLGISVNG